MRSRHIWKALCAFSPVVLSNAACGDDVGGSGGSGGEADVTSSSTSTTGVGQSTSSASTSASSSSGATAASTTAAGMTASASSGGEGSQGVGGEGGEGGAPSFTTVGSGGGSVTASGSSGAGGAGSGSAGSGGAGSGGSGSGGAGSGATSSAAGAGGGPPLLPAWETCPGEGFQLDHGSGFSIVDSTVGLMPDHSSFCMATKAADAVYQFRLDAACTLSVDLTDSNGLDGVVSLRRTACDVEEAGDQCFDFALDDEGFRQHEEPGLIWLMVQGAQGSEGDYLLNVQCDPPACGDGVWNPGEQCDPGMGAPLDGCGDPGAPNECQVEAADAADTCAGLAASFSIPAGASAFPASDPVFSSADASDDYKGPCAPQGELGGKDEVFAFVPEASGMLSVVVGADRSGAPYCQTWTEPECWYRFVYVKEADCSAGAVVACNEIDFTNGLNDLTIPVTAGQTYYLFVDGLNGEFYSMGPYLISFDLQ